MPKRESGNPLPTMKLTPFREWGLFTFPLDCPDCGTRLVDAQKKLDRGVTRRLKTRVYPAQYRDCPACPYESQSITRAMTQADADTVTAASVAEIEAMLEDVLGDDDTEPERTDIDDLLDDVIPENCCQDD